MNQISSQRLLAAHSLLPHSWEPVTNETHAFAPINIALAKYWGKRDEDLHLPITDSFSLCLNLGTTTTLSQGKKNDIFWLNNNKIDPTSSFFRRMQEFLNLVRPDPTFTFSIHTENMIPTDAGLASSASGFAALTLALNKFFGWNLNLQKLSCLARLGSGSACRSIHPGFMFWHKGEKENGSDSYADPFPEHWEELSLGILYISTKKKEIDSREAMKRSQETSPFYSVWPKIIKKNLHDITKGIITKDFCLFGQAVEQNALAMHALMHTALPPFSYHTEETITAMKKIWLSRKEGIEMYFTMDAGPNIKILFLKKDIKNILSLFPVIKQVDLYQS